MARADFASRPHEINGSLFGRWILSEHLIRGAYLGLVVGGAFWVQTAPEGISLVLSTAIPIIMVLAIKVWSRRRQPGLWPAGVLLAVIDSPAPIHWAAALGLAIGLLRMGVPIGTLALSIFLGTAAGAGIFLLYRLRSSTLRRSLMLTVLLATLAVVILLATWDWIDWRSLGRPAGGHLLFAAGTLYLLLFAGRSEEAEFDIGIVALLLAFGLASLIDSRTGRAIVVLGPTALYALYCERARRHLIVFKHVVRGIGHEQNKRWPDALTEYRLALATDPRSTASSEGSWRVHQRIDIEDLDRHPGILSMIDPLACFQRIDHLLARSDFPDSTSQEVQRLLSLIDRCDSKRAWQTRQIRVKLHTMQGNIDEAISLARPIKDLTTDEMNLLSERELASAQGIWELLLEDPLLVGRSAEFLSDGGVCSFVTLMEWQATKFPKNENSQRYRPFMYLRLTLADYQSARRLPQVLRFPMLHPDRLLEAAHSHASHEQTQSAAIDLWEIAALENPAQAMTYWREAAELADRFDGALAAKLRWRIHDAGLDQGVRTLSGSQRNSFDQTIRRLALSAEQESNRDESLRLWELFALSSSSGKQTCERLLSLYLEKKDLLSAIRQVEAILLFDLARDERAQWIETRNKLYADLDPLSLASRAQEAESFFHFRYCSRRAAQLLELGASDQEIDHYLQLAQLGPASELRLVNYILGRSHARGGRFADAAQCLEACCLEPPGSRSDEEEKLAYHRACRLLGEICINQIEDPERGIRYLLLFKDHVESGADTLFLLGRGYEMLGSIKSACKWYDMVTVYSSHPRAAEAREAIHRLTNVP
jgi:tetratricopeptide (TPR) repeat protein